MTKGKAADPGLRLVWDYRDCETTVGKIRLAIAPATTPPFEVDAVVAEQDTHLLMDEGSVIREPEKPTWVIANELEGQKTQQPGTVIVQDGRPLRFLAIVHDVARDPTWREQWIAKALGMVFVEAGRCGIVSLGVPPLATQHGRYPMDRFLELLHSALKLSDSSLRRVWLMLPPGLVATTILRRITQEDNAAAH